MHCSRNAKSRCGTDSVCERAAAVCLLEAVRFPMARPASLPGLFSFNAGDVHRKGAGVDPWLAESNWFVVAGSGTHLNSRLAFERIFDYIMPPRDHALSLARFDSLA